jgi:hypothetical protein
MRGGTDLDRLHPGYFLPTEAVGLVASAGAAEVGQHRFAQVMLGLRLICSIVGSMILVRLIFRPPLPEALLPTMAIEVAPRRGPERRVSVHHRRTRRHVRRDPGGIRTADGDGATPAAPP